MRIAIVNDMAMAVEALRRVIVDELGHTLVWIGRNGAEAVERCAQDTPDMILMDLVMPVMDGAEATRHIMKHSPCAILVVTATVEGHSSKVFEALGAGALDAVETPSPAIGGQWGGVSQLKVKIRSIQRLISTPNGDKPTHSIESARQPAAPSANTLVVMGASAGGPAALATILRDLPEDFDAAIVIVQHIDERFAPSMATWLNDQSALTVRIAREKDRPESRVVLIASTTDHLVFLNSHVLGYTSEPLDSHYRPSVDVFFESVASYWKGDLVAALLTGMGRDGAKGLKTLRQNGALTIAQDANSSVVYGMPKAAADLDAAVEILPLAKISLRLTAFVKSRTVGALRESHG